MTLRTRKRRLLWTRRGKFWRPGSAAVGLTMWASGCRCRAAVESLLASRQGAGYIHAPTNHLRRHPTGFGYHDQHILVFAMCLCVPSCRGRTRPFPPKQRTTCSLPIYGCAKRPLVQDRSSKRGYKTTIRVGLQSSPSSLDNQDAGPRLAVPHFFRKHTQGGRCW